MSEIGSVHDFEEAAEVCQQKGWSNEHTGISRIVVPDSAPDHQLTAIAQTLTATMERAGLIRHIEVLRQSDFVHLCLERMLWE